jgi:hypothetical protein
MMVLRFRWLKSTTCIGLAALLALLLALTPSHGLSETSAPPIIIGAGVNNYRYRLGLE